MIHFQFLEFRIQFAEPLDSDCAIICHTSIRRIPSVGLLVLFIVCQKTKKSGTAFGEVAPLIYVGAVSLCMVSPSGRSRQPGIFLSES